MSEMLIALVAGIPLVALLAFLVVFGDDRRAKIARLHQELKDREADRYLKLHRLHPTTQGNYPVHLGDLDLDYLLASPGNPEKVNLLVSNNITREVAPDRTPLLTHNGRELSPPAAPAAPAAPAPVDDAQETEELPPAAPVLELPAPAPALTEYEMWEVLTSAKKEGYNQKQALELIGVKKSGSSPAFKLWASRFNNLPK